MSYAGVGAIVRGVEDRLAVVVDIRYWQDRNKINPCRPIPYVTRIIKSLGISQELFMPPVARQEAHEQAGIAGSYLPTVLFPRSALCKQCGLLHQNPWTIDLSEDVYCESCGYPSRLDQLTWCAVSKNGYLDEVPWHYLAHLNSARLCQPDYDSSYLRFDTDRNGKRVIKCTRCGSQGVFENRKIPFIGRQQPWIDGETPELEDDELVEILEVNNPGVYLPESVSALVIPPESRINKTTLVAKLYNNSKLLREIETITIPLRKKSKFRQIASQYRASIDDVKAALQQIQQGYPFLQDILHVGDLLEDEYKAFLTPLDELREDEDFVIEHQTDDWKTLDKTGLSDELTALIYLIDDLVIAKRLREIQLFKGFYRVSIDEDKVLVPPDIVGESDWLPTIELFGEGVFITFNRALLIEWESLPEVKKRADQVQQRYQKSELSFLQDTEISARFLLLHTCAHLLIRELECVAGYPAASLKERIYCSSPGGSDHGMAGLLIYTSAADIVGTLGGIIESVQPKALLRLLDGAFNHARWCSLDPVCSEHEGQGPGWLNRAACHACALVPEPSCEYRNIFLDRVFIKGNQTLNIPGLLEWVGKTVVG